MNINTTIREIAQQIEVKDLTEVLVDLISKIIEIFIENELTEFLHMKSIVLKVIIQERVEIDILLELLKVYLVK